MAQTQVEPQVLYRDAQLLAVDKPAGMIVHADGTGARTLTDCVRDMLTAEDSTEAARDLQALNRLDRDTTGIVLFCLDKTAQAKLDAVVAAHETNKRYLAITCGIPGWDRKTIDRPLARDRHDARRMRAAKEGKESKTRVQLLAARKRTSTAPDLSLLDIRLLTGRKHQIRVHLADAGHPLLGDTLYGRQVRAGARGKLYPLMLHAWQMTFTQPITGETVRIEAPIPRRFTKLFSEKTIEEALVRARVSHRR